MKWLIVIAISLPPILVLLQHLYRTLPNYNETRILNSVFGEIKIQRTAKGIPEITAESIEDVFFAWGYVHAQDRLWQLDILRRTASGTLSEFLGKEALEKDIFARNLQFKKNAQRLVNLSPKSEILLKRYCEGINSYADTAFLPIEYFITWNKWKRWEVIDTLSIWRYLSFIISVDYQSDLLRSELVQILGSSLELMPIDEDKIFDSYSTIQGNELPRELYRFNEHSRVEDSEKGQGYNGNPSFTEASNAWVVSGLFTKSGKPIIANDPHLMSYAPSLLYLSSAKWEKYSLHGASIPGIPVLLSGSNQKLAWGVSSLTSDTMDLYTHTVTGKSYLFSGRFIDFSTFSEEIRVKGQKSVVITFDTTNSGPILYGKNNISIRWAADEIPDTSFEGFLQLIFASSTRSVRLSLEKIVIPALGILYGNEEGDIGYQAVGIHPLREYAAVGVLDGSKESKRWKGFIQYEELPYVINPPKGFIVSANNRPVTSMYRHFRSIGSEFAEGRARRIDFLLESLIGSKQKIDAKDMSAIQLDEFSNLAFTILPVWLNMTNNKQAIYSFKNWDFYLSKSSTQAALFMSWYLHFCKILLPTSLPPSTQSKLLNSRHYRNLISKSSTSSSSLFYLCSSQCSSLLSDSFALALSEVSSKSWGDLHPSHHHHLPLTSLPYLSSLFDLKAESGGSDLTVNSKSFTWSSSYSSHFGSEGRLIFDLGSFEQSLWSISTGISGNFFSSQYSSLHSSFSKGEFEPIISPATSKSSLLPSS